MDIGRPRLAIEGDNRQRGERTTPPRQTDTCSVEKARVRSRSDGGRKGLRKEHYKEGETECRGRLYVKAESGRARGP
jgi:hypothetical protein